MVKLNLEHFEKFEHEKQGKIIQNPDLFYIIVVY